ncbi:hypothetical protein VNO77_35769 [Canavalia gladiata]|uniref:Protein CDI-like n=1 Tax=Canavalia gladiata TaxID=3824 RepID=A0AAN9K733_CANGL
MKQRHKLFPSSSAFSTKFLLLSPSKFCSTTLFIPVRNSTSVIYPLSSDSGDKCAFFILKLNVILLILCFVGAGTGRHIQLSAEMSRKTNGGDGAFKIFIGYDSREDIAYEVCCHSLLKKTSIPIEIIPIKQSDLRKNSEYWRETTKLESTEFSFTRFLTPYLANFEGWAMFVDCDFLYLADIKELKDLIDDKYAVMCVHHDYAPKETTKMDGAVQTVYPRKNWSSMVLYNCGHPKNRVLTPDTVSTQTGAFLHRFQWLEDGEIGSIPFVWNFLEGHNKVVDNDPSTSPKAIHYTRGGPWFEAWKNCEFADLWIREKEEYLNEAKKAVPN